MAFSYDPYAPEMLADPYPAYEVLRREHRVYPLPQYDALALSCFEEVWAVLGDAERFTIVEAPVYVKERVSTPFVPGTIPPAAPDRTFATWDPPAHTRLRARMAAHFGPGHVRRLEARGREAARERLAELVPAGRFDVARDYAAPVSVELISRVIGLPVEEGPTLTRLVNRASRREAGRPGPTPDAMAAQGETLAWIEAVVARHRARGASDASTLDALLSAEVEGRALTDAEIATQLHTLLTGGAETMPKIIAGGIRELARAPAQRAALAARPAELGRGAFEEMMRHQGVLQHVGRTALVDLEVLGHPVRAGQRLFCLLQSANRDVQEFDRPDVFDIERRPRRSLALGHGPHHCIGAHLARLEGRILAEELVRAVPEYEVDESALERPPSEFQVGYTSLVVDFQHSLS